MSQAIVNPQELRAFAQRLKQFNTVLTDQAAMLAQTATKLIAVTRLLRHFMA